MPKPLPPAAAAQAAAEAEAAAAAEAKAAADAAAAAAEAEAQAATDAKAEADAAAEAAAQAQMDAEQELADDAKAEQDADLRSLFAGLLIEDDTTVTPNITAFDAEPVITASHGMMAVIEAPAEDAAGSNAAFATGTRTSVAALGDWSGTDMLAVNAALGITDHLNVYTDIDVGTELTFEMLFPEADSDLQDHYTEATREVTLAGLNMHQGVITGNMADDFQTGSGERTHGNPAITTEEHIIPGTFAGASGNYRCIENNNNCISRGTNAGTMLAGTWTFNVDAGEMASIPDGNYNRFGWWLRIDNTGAWDVDVFHGSNMTAAAVATALTGTATYEGQAAGKVAIDPQLPGEDPMGGSFTADAMLTANFEAGDGSGMVSGMIDNIMVGDHETNWSVALGAANIADGASVISEGATTWSIDDAGSSTSGAWSGSFWGAGTDDVPGSVTGEFTATYNGEVGRMERGLRCQQVVELRYCEKGEAR